MEIFVLTVSPAHMATEKHCSFQILPDQKIMRPTFRMKINKVAKINKYKSTVKSHTSNFWKTRHKVAILKNSFK